MNKKVIEKAKELSEMLREHETTRKYHESISAMKNDKTSQELLEKLIYLGRQLNENYSKGENIKLNPSQELENLRQELESNTITKNYILNQKEYLKLISEIMERIKNPVKPK